MVKPAKENSLFFLLTLFELDTQYLLAGLGVAQGDACPFSQDSPLPESFKHLNDISAVDLPHRPQMFQALPLERVLVECLVLFLVLVFAV